jgi:hypothetical protein
MELIAAALVGSILAAMRHTHKGKTKTCRVMLTGFALALFTVDDVVNIIQHSMNFQVGKGGILFLISFVGAEVLERVVLVIRTVDVSMKWSKKHDDP